MIHGSDTISEIQDRITRFNHPIDIRGLGVQDAINLYNKNLSLEYLTGYLIEYSLSVDNVFVIVMIFMSFNIQPKYFKRVLFWGIMGAVVMRFIFIFAASPHPAIFLVPVCVRDHAGCHWVEDGLGFSVWQEG